MKKYSLPALAIISLLISFGLGYMLASLEPADKPVVPGKNQVVIGAESDIQLIDDQTKIIYEQEYLRCNHLLISSFPDQSKLLGKTLDELKLQLKPEHGYTLLLEDNTLTIHQKIEDWCPAEKEKCRLKEYQGYLAVYKGPDWDSDILLRVSGIKIESLPEQVAEDIRQGNYEFDTEEALNDALENLDEYIQ
jgi:hypothetical protein